jgi:two-component system CheB/CheR fusion protein
MKSKPLAARQPAKSRLPKAARGTAAAVRFPIVGIGASAGGLEALEQFLGSVPAGSGLAFVIVQHLDPTRKGIMPELLQRATRMKVLQVKDRLPVRPDCVYVIPPNKDMSILHGILHLFEPAASRGLRLPIDFFFRSLALDRQESSIGIILSGMGSDGTLGLRAIKEHAGLVLVQNPASAKFDAMPRSAIDAGLADIVADVQELPEKLLAYLKRAPLLSRTPIPPEEKTRSALEKTVILLRAQTGHDFSLYKRNTLYRRIERRMGLHQVANMTAYVRYLQQNPQEVDLLFKELLIGVTNFFRDPAYWELLRKKAIPALLASRPPGHTFRAWVTGCSTGEEAYSLAMVFREAVTKSRTKQRCALQIFATDLDRDAIDRARLGTYPLNIAADVPPERLKRFFTKEETGYRVRNEIREMVIFAPQNLIMEPPFTRLDLLCCRNLLIYLGPEVQKKLIPLFHYALLPGGILFLGSAESIGADADLFTPFDAKSRLFVRSDSVRRADPVEFPVTYRSDLPDNAPASQLQKPAASLQTQADQMVLQHFSPPTVLANDKGDIFYISGRTSNYLEPAAGKANWNLFAMAREELRYELAGAFQKALRQKERVLVNGIQFRVNGVLQAVDLAVQRLNDSGVLHGLVMIMFTSVPVPCPPKAAHQPPKGRPGSARVAELERELLRTRAEGRSSLEEMQTSQEELRSSNEELQSTVEELQSTNEELTTSKEEMQSLNEELQTLNAESQSKFEELSRNGNDMKNLLNSTDIATLFLDNDLTIRRFTPSVVRIIKLLPGDIGRPITDLVSDLDYQNFPGDIRRVLRTRLLVEKTARTLNDRWYRLRIMPYRTAEDRVDGVVITFFDITTSKKLEAKLRSRQSEHARRKPRG